MSWDLNFTKSFVILSHCFFNSQGIVYQIRIRNMHTGLQLECSSPHSMPIMTYILVTARWISRAHGGTASVTWRILTGRTWEVHTQHSLTASSGTRGPDIIIRWNSLKWKLLLLTEYQGFMNKCFPMLVIILEAFPNLCTVCAQLAKSNVLNKRNSMHIKVYTTTRLLQLYALKCAADIHQSSIYRFI